MNVIKNNFIKNSYKEDDHGKPGKRSTKELMKEE